jgi:DMSO/TMAO reductase YedYZ molybdopterin-dependent catalytic subunit
MGSASFSKHRNPHTGRWVVPGGECFTSIKWLDRLELRSEPGLSTAETIALTRLSSSTDPRRSGSKS